MLFRSPSAETVAESEDANPAKDDSHLNAETSDRESADRQTEIDLTH